MPSDGTNTTGDTIASRFQYPKPPKGLGAVKPAPARAKPGKKKPKSK